MVPVPFAADRETINQKTKKSTNDIKGNPFRLSKAYYRWHHRSGLGVREGCQFECNLRLSKRCETLNNPEQSGFKNQISPIQFRVEKKKYKESDLVCSRQRKVFTMEVQ